MIFLDLETFNPQPSPLKNGVYVYAQNVEILIVVWAVDNGPVQLWDVTQNPELPTVLRELLDDNTQKIVAHNAQFDRVCLSTRSDVPANAKAISRWFCTRALAYQSSLVGSLDDLSTLFKLGTLSKDKSGKKLIGLFCGLDKKGVRSDYKTHNVEWQAFCDYARRDIVALRELYKKLPKWNAQDLTVYWLDQKINDRGFLIDHDFALNAQKVIDERQAQLKQKIKAVTAGVVQSSNERAKFIEYVRQSFGVELPDTQSATIARFLNSEIDPALRELLENRAEMSNAAVSKYARLLTCANSDHRIRGSLVYAGASRTGRWSGTLFQPQNLARSSSKYEQVLGYIESVKSGCGFELLADPLKNLSDCLRSVIIAPNGKQFAIADLANIEGRLLAWLAGERWKIDAFKAFDAKVGHDLYKLAYAQTFKIDVNSVNSEQRQIGKVLELAMGYAGGASAFATFARAYNVDLDQLSDSLTLSPRVKKQAAENLAFAKKMKRNLGMGEGNWLACEAIKIMWRLAHPKTVNFWAACKDAVLRLAVDKQNPITVGRLVFDVVGKWLRIKLPSGRFLIYPNFRLENGQILYDGRDGFSRKWGAIKTHGGKIVENVVQAVARDVLVFGIFEAEKCGFDVVLTVHDEIIAECNLDKTAQDLVDCMTRLAPWADGLPLNAEGFSSERYRK